jgi:hypothetical protein
MIVFPLIRSVGLKAATASSRVAMLPMFVRSRPSRTRWTISPSWAPMTQPFFASGRGIRQSKAETCIWRDLVGFDHQTSCVLSIIVDEKAYPQTTLLLQLNSTVRRRAVE